MAQVAQQETDNLHEREREIYEADKIKTAVQIKLIEDELAVKNKRLGELEVIYLVYCIVDTDFFPILFFPLQREHQVLQQRCQSAEKERAFAVERAERAEREMPEFVAQKNALLMQVFLFAFLKTNTHN